MSIGQPLALAVCPSFDTGWARSGVNGPLTWGSSYNHNTTTTLFWQFPLFITKMMEILTYATPTKTLTRDSYTNTATIGIIITRIVPSVPLLISFGLSMLMTWPLPHHEKLAWAPLAYLVRVIKVPRTVPGQIINCLTPPAMPRLAYHRCDCSKIAPFFDR